jgi:hypothetical protein
MSERDDQLENFVLRERARLTSHKATLGLRMALIILLAFIVAGAAFLLLN